MIEVVAQRGNEKSKYLKIVKVMCHVSTLKNTTSLKLDLSLFSESKEEE